MCMEQVLHGDLYAYKLTLYFQELPARAHRLCTAALQRLP